MRTQIESAVSRQAEMSHPLTCIDALHASGSKTHICSSKAPTPPLHDSKSSAIPIPRCPFSSATFCFADRKTWGWTDSSSSDMVCGTANEPRVCIHPSQEGLTSETTRFEGKEGFRRSLLKELCGKEGFPFAWLPLRCRTPNPDCRRPLTDFAAAGQFLARVLEAFRTWKSAPPAASLAPEELVLQSLLQLNKAIV
ncbi:hypothetical protein K505DRAFT_69377 [Melanomma pulvis-pyrius CBS 109.77]|uniref:Uncharacterized protein n=1 Tax=Melanomma pulvis-pyrius CBS 109.77 TaxID=1314802 RepID=A0A6A6X4U8_9PLEO|nr:hypothetical protein K505DRAFT_69377 [Melanomma pulvis-pyrius CBS 109.77]